MSKLPNQIGIIGNGFVGSTLHRTLKRLYGDKPIKVYDIDSDKSNCYFHMMGICDLIFICLPTPMVKETGECYTGYIEETLKELNEIKARMSLPSFSDLASEPDKSDKCREIVIKSTVPPNTISFFDKTYPHLDIVYNPEFLRETSPYEDFKNATHHIIGYDYRQNYENLKVYQLYKELGNCGILNFDNLYVISTQEAALIKYTRNAYLATRLSFFNEIYDLCETFETDYETVSNLAGLDERIGTHYNRVDPNDRGFDGHCLPKDLVSVLRVSEYMFVNAPTLQGVWRKNLDVNQKREWEKMEGRSIISKS